MVRGKDDNQPETALDLILATRWSMITQVIDGVAGASVQALDELAVRYRYAVYAYVRLCGHVPAIALDITRSFMRHLPRHFRDVDRSAAK